jgi:threonyl-tRNA synthetase
MLNDVQIPLIEITLPDGSRKKLPLGATGRQLADSIGPRLAKDAVALVMAGDILDLNTPLPDGAEVRILTTKDPQALEVLRHSSAHIMAQAVQCLFPGARIANGPATETGFFYDFYIPDHKLTPEDLERIEAEMQRIIGMGQVFKRRDITDPDAQLAQFQAQGEVYKAENLNQYRDANPTLYVCVNPVTQQDIWSDFCRGPHLPDTSFIRAFKLLSLAGAYWKGDESREMLQRVYATSFFSTTDLEAFLHQRAEAEKRDHRRLGKQLDLFSMEYEVGPGLILWHPNLAVVREELENYWRKEHRRRGYEIVYCPHIAKKDLWNTSGHTSFYMENMFPLQIEGEDYILKPMNCPFHVLIYKSRLHSYRELPLRIAELGTVYRYEKSGVMHGLTRVRGFTQDDAHLFCRPEQLTDEIIAIIRFIDDTLTLFGMRFEVELSTRPEKYIGDLSLWEQAESGLKTALESYGLAYHINEGDGAFYGPKIDFKLQDAIGRTWQCATVQLDFNLPQRFELTYQDADGSHKTPVMLHRVIFGSMERFAGTLIEHYAGAFPLWLSPVQVQILPIADRHTEAAQKLETRLREADVRVKTDARNEGIGHKIRDAQLAKVPYMLILGDKEIEAGTVSVRSRTQGDMGAMVTDAFISQVLHDIAIKQSNDTECHQS